MYKHISLVLILLVPMASHSAGFDCGKASTKIEKLVCQDTEVSGLDSKMSGLYEQALAASETSQLKKQQQRWLRDTRDQCSDTSCLLSVYS